MASPKKSTKSRLHKRVVMLYYLLRSVESLYYMGYMSTDKTLHTITTDSSATTQLGAALGAALRGGEVIELVSDLGGGKTTFVKGLAAGAGITDTVQSPTFMISRIYPGSSFDVHHFDFYRLHEAGIVGAELAELLHDERAVVVIEWGDVVHDILPAHRIRIQITVQPDGSRKLTATVPSEHTAFIEAWQNFNQERGQHD